jgi:hypothetical protein
MPIRNRAQYILTRRTREFDRSEIFSHPFRFMVPHAGAGHRTTSYWRKSRRLIADTTSPGFLQNVAGPHNHSDARSLMQLWKAKGAVARGRPFDIASDLEEIMNDSIFAVKFGVSRGGIDAKLEALSYPPVKAIVCDHEVIVFPTAKLSTVYDDIATVLGSPGDRTEVSHWCVASCIWTKILPKTSTSCQAQGSLHTTDA